MHAVEGSPSCCSKRSLKQPRQPGDWFVAARVFTVIESYNSQATRGCDAGGWQP